ncbi:MAG: biopolymer transporter ExbD [Candidatus Fermentibacteraceae bacterium]|nr:biopolymer transporter ExbD [Candidatus Fermentibacteraceae bacterium]
MIRQKYRQFSSINVTNLVDVTFVLLVIFMLSAPVMQRSTDITPPSTDQGQIIQRLDPGTSLVVEMDGAGNITVAGETVAPEDLSALAEAALSSGRTEAYLRADGQVQYAILAAALTELRRGGYANVGLIQESTVAVE